jgi:hypothetical protein
MPNIYLVDYWVPFPSSEYGGVQVVIANSDGHCVELMLEKAEDYYTEQYPDYQKMISDCVKKAKRFPVDAECGVVYEFRT